MKQDRTKITEAQYKRIFERYPTVPQTPEVYAMLQAVYAAAYCRDTMHLDAKMAKN